VTSSWFCLSK